MPLSQNIRNAHQKLGYKPTEIEEDAINVVSELIEENKELTTWVTRDVAFNMREIIRRARKNYLGVFEDGSKDLLGNERVWHHLTQSFVEAEVKNTDVDPKDITIDAETQESQGAAIILRSKLKEWMRKVNFGRALNNDIRNRAIDGHVIRKVIKNSPLEGVAVDTKSVDLLRIFIDGNADSLHTSPFAEQAILNTSDIKKQFANTWMNLEFLMGRETVNDMGIDESRRVNSPVPLTEVYEYHSDIPEWWVHGDKEKWMKDGRPYKLGVVIISNIYDAPVVHKVMFNTEKIKPYEESRLIEVNNRYLGMGRAEQLFGYQLYFNLLYETRRLNHLLSANQLFYFKKGSGITPQHIARLITGGAIPVNNPDDIGRIDTRDFNFSSSIQEEQSMVDSAQRLTDQNDVALGGSVPASTPATIGVIQERSQGRGSQLKREEFGRYVENLLNRHILPRIKGSIAAEDVIALTDDIEKLKKLDDRLATFFANREFIKRVEDGEDVRPEEIDAEIQRLKQEFTKMGGKRWVKLVKDFFGNSRVVASMVVDNEHEDRQQVLSTLQSILFNIGQTNPNIDGDSILAEIIDTLGLDADLILQRKTVTEQLEDAQARTLGAENQPRPRVQSSPESSILGQAEQLAQ